MPNVFIIGNGFDLDLGLPTHYSDFAKSSFWPKASPMPSQSSNTNYGNVLRVGHSSNSILLEHYLENKKNLNTWFDLDYILRLRIKEMGKKVNIL